MRVHTPHWTYLALLLSTASSSSKLNLNVGPQGSGEGKDTCEDRYVTRAGIPLGFVAGSTEGLCYFSAIYDGHAGTEWVETAAECSPGASAFNSIFSVSGVISMHLHMHTQLRLVHQQIRYSVVHAIGTVCMQCLHGVYGTTLFAGD